MLHIYKDCWLHENGAAVLAVRPFRLSADGERENKSQRAKPQRECATKIHGFPPFCWLHAEGHALRRYCLNTDDVLLGSPAPLLLPHNLCWTRN